MRVEYLHSTTALADFCAAARSDGRVGLDTEFHRERRYYPQLALVQLAVEGREALLDPLNGAIDLGPLDALLADESVVKILHAPDQDLEIFYIRFGRCALNVFDTQTAAAMLGLGAQVSLAGLVDKVLGLRLAKGQSFTDWLRRPLSGAQERYALDDVRHLLALHDGLCTDLRSLQREDWLREELRRFEVPERYEPALDILYQKVKRYRSLDSRRQAVLRELAVWRDAAARRRDRNRRAIMADDVLLEVARSSPADQTSLRKLRGMQSDTANREGDDILAAVARGLRVPDDQCPRPAPGRPPGEAAELAAAIVQAFLKVYCKEIRIEPTMVGTVADVERLVCEYVAGDLDAGGIPMLQGWRGELVGERVMDFLRGKLAVRLEPGTAKPTFEVAGL